MLSSCVFADEFTLSETDKTVETESDSYGVLTFYITSVAEETLNFDPTRIYGNCTEFTTEIKNLSAISPGATDASVFLYEIPIQYHGYYECEMEYDSGHEEKTLMLRFNITDKSPPEIEMFDISPDTQEVMKPINLKSKAEDNVEILNLTVNFTILNITKTSVLQWDNDTQNWVATVHLDQVGDWKAVLTVVDVNGNFQEEVKWIKITNIEGFTKLDTLSLGLLKISTTVSKEIVFLTQDTDLYLDVKPITSTAGNTSNFSVNLITPSASFNLLEVAQIDLKSVRGLIRLEVYSDENITFSGDIDVTAPPYMDFNHISFYGTFTDYDICDKREEILFGHPLTMNPVVNTNKEDSYCQIIQNLPIDTKWENVRGFASNIDEYNRQLQICDGARQTEASRASSCESGQGTIIMLLIMAIIMFLSYRHIKTYLAGRLNFGMR